MAVRQGRCTTFGNCSIADKKEIVQVPEGADFACPECGRSLTEMSSPRKPTSARKLPILAAVLLAIVGAAIWYVTRAHSSAVADSNSTLLLRLSGSNTIGAELGPMLAEEFLKQQGATDVKVVPSGKEDEKIVQGTLPGTSSPVSIRIAAHGSATAFSGLAEGSCDIGMASRKIKPEEATQLARFGDMTSFANEHVVGLDGIAVIVNRSNPVVSLSKDQLADIFSGRTRDWSQVGGRPGSIAIYARDNKSGTYDTFKTLILGNAPLEGSAKRFEDSNALSDAIASDSNGIGFVGLPYIRSAKAVAVSERGATPLQPNRLTVGTEDYALSRRLYLYTPSSPQNKYVRQFVEFALSTAGQNVVSKAGFVGQNIVPPPGVGQQSGVTKGAPSEYTGLTSNAERLSLNFRFRTGSSELDNKALVDLDRVVEFISDLKYSGDRVLLFGFADSTGDPAKNLDLSRRRADTVQAQFRQRGLNPGVVKGFGSSLPVASNDTTEGREKNRRVEIWVRK